VYEKAAQEPLIRTALEHFTKSAITLEHQAEDPLWMQKQIASWNAIHRPPLKRALFEWSLQQTMKNKLLEAFKRTLYDLLRCRSLQESGIHSRTRAATSVANSGSQAADSQHNSVSRS
jgi:hypothetical protein